MQPAPQKRGPVVVGLVVVVLAALGAGYLIGGRLAAASTGELAQLRPVVSATPAPPFSMLDVGRAALSRTVTVEVITSTDEHFGTAWLFDTHGDFVTNAHVISGQESIRLRDRSGGSHVATVAGTDPKRDIAVLRSEDGFGQSPLPISTTPVTVAQAVVAIASSRSTGQGDLTLVHVSRIGVSVSTHDTLKGSPTSEGVATIYPNMIGITGAVIYEGNSGGPLLDANGDVIGIVTLASRTTPDAYALPLTAVLGEIQRFAAS